MPIERDDDMGLVDAWPWEVKREVGLTNIVFQAVDDDVRKSKTSDTFKQEWQGLYDEWMRYYKSIWTIEMLRDEVYKRAMQYRNRAESFRNALVKVGATITPQSTIEAADKKLNGTKENPKDDGFSWGKVFAVLGGFVAVRWLWKKAGEPSKVSVNEDDDMIMLEE